MSLCLLCACLQSVCNQIKKYFYLKRYIFPRQTVNFLLFYNSKLSLTVSFFSLTLTVSFFGATEGSYIIDGSASSFLVFLLRKTGLLLIAERKSAKMSLWSQKNVVNSNNSWNCLGNQSVLHL